MSGALVPLLGLFAFVCVAMGAWSLRTMFVPDHSMRDRVARATRQRGGIRENSLFGADEATPSIRFQFSKIAQPATEQERNVLRERLVQAGFRSSTNM